MARRQSGEGSWEICAAVSGLVVRPWVKFRVRASRTWLHTGGIGSKRAAVGTAATCAATAAASKAARHPAGTRSVYTSHERAIASTYAFMTRCEPVIGSTEVFASGQELVIGSTDVFRG